MESGKDFVLVEKEAGGLKPVSAEPRPGNANSKSPEQSTARLLSTLTSAVCSQHTADLAKLYRELKDLERERRRFQKDVADTLLKLESALGALTEVLTGLESRTDGVEQRLREEEDRGAARSKILGFLLSREKELRKKCALLEKMLLKKSAWLEGVVHKWTKADRNPT